MSDLSFNGAARTGLLERWTRPVSLPAWWRWPVALVLGVLTLPRVVAPPGVNSDLSWGAGLALAQQQGLHFGHDIVFTFGPLGFLTADGMFVVWQTVAALIFALLVQLLFCATLLYAVRALPTATGVAVVAFVASAPTPGPYIALATVFAFSVTMLVREEPMPRWVPGVGGAAAAVLVLVVPTVGVEAFAAMALVAAVGGGRRLRAVGELTASFLAGVTGLWLATGNALGDFIPWVRGVSQLVSGYTSGMMLIDPSRHGDVVKGLALAAILSVFLARSAMGLPRARQAALVIVWAVCGFGAFKEGFVRLDGHEEIFFAVSAAAALSLARGRATRFVVAALAVVATGWAFGAIGDGMQSMLDYPARVNRLASTVRMLATPTEREAFIAKGRTSIIEPLHLPPSIVRDLRAHTVDVGPWETSAAWALGLRWRPQPIFQTYAVLTPELDRLDAELLRSSRAPERVLRITPRQEVDGRNAVFDAPAAYLALVCNYRETFASQVVEVLARSTNRCGSTRSLGGSDTRAGTTVRVPTGRPDELIYARLIIPRVWSERLRELLWKPATVPAIVLDREEFRLAAATASGPLLMRMPKGARIAASSLSVPHVHSFRILRVSGVVHVAFYAVRIGASR